MRRHLLGTKTSKGVYQDWKKLTDDMRGDENRRKRKKERRRVRENEKRGRIEKTSEKRGKLREEKGKKVKKTCIWQQRKGG